MTPRQAEFCRFIAQGMSAQQAAKDAGYTAQYAKSKSGALARKPEIIAEVQRLRQRLNERADKSATDVVNEYSTIAFTDRTGFLKPDEDFPGCYVYKSPDELDDDQRAVVEKVTTTWRKVERTINGEKKLVERQEFNYVLADKMNALQQMGRHFGIFDDKIKLQLNQQNPFKNASPEQLQQLKASFVGIMSGGQVVDGEYRETGAPHLLPNGEGRTGAGK